MESERDRESSEFGAMRSGLIVPASLPAPLSCHYRHPFDVPCQRNQRPIPSHRLQTPQEELPEGHHRLDNAEHWLHRLFAQSIERTSLDCFESVLHPVHIAGRLGQRRRLAKAFLPVGVMRIAPRSKERIDLRLDTTLDI